MRSDLINKSSSSTSTSIPIQLDRPTVTSYLAQNPHLSPHRAAIRLFPKAFWLKRLWLRFKIKEDLYHRLEPDPQQIERAYRSGRWSSDHHQNQSSSPPRPGQLFLKIFSDVLLCLERNQLSGLVSPPLIACSCVIPLTILSVIPHIMQHYYDCIVLAEHEVLLATNYLQKSDSLNKINEALIELSRRIGESETKKKVVVKLIYDRGNWQQVFKNHQAVRPGSSAWKSVGLPRMEEIPNLELEVINFHKVLLGTFHAKFMVVDRKIALLNSNNIQDRPNIEMMARPIVDSFYDMFLISWNNKLKPTLPLINGPPSQSSPEVSGYQFASDNPFLRNIDIVKSAQDARATLNREAESDRAASINQQQEGFSGFASVVRDLMEDRRRARQPVEGPSVETVEVPRSPSTRFSSAVQHIIEEGRRLKGTSQPPTVAGRGFARRATRLNESSEKPKVPRVFEINNLRNDSPTTSAFGGSCCGSSEPTSPAPRVSIKTDSENVRKPDSDNNRHARAASTGSSFRAFGSHLENKNTQNPSSKSVKNRMRALSDALNAGTLRQAVANVSEDHQISDFQPHVIHQEHKEVPIVMVNRPPHGFPGHNDIRVPQNAAWMAGFRYAEKKVFIQTPTLNSTPVVKMCIDAAKRGVTVILYLDLGFNDKGESIPFQGGTNQEVVIKMYKALKKFDKQKNLMVYWYTGKDQIRPINAVLKSRNCHVKFMAIDDCVGIQGNGNQDTQSWFHSQEVNVMIDSEQIVKEWMRALICNQNTELYGKVHDDGIWRDEAGRTVSEVHKRFVCKNLKGKGQRLN
ncbi:hypothetical protein BY996DRAFT_4581352 [Phakopsora pachyrhizi]|uniref:PLD phosphodiesterase domain-containing protein n=1 Tax=Phakopsora pachyrhizi TaxID=170000 RepID=A0AAV0AUY4_PHAPC|nr:hypothetical protein BY996DRAFT_4581352 [Phakopsora pachyrhizi]CAH7672639.1 hypothetical protein PPACK8108_LOCUS7455 [Phakopsora pachyrhizi]